MPETKPAPDTKAATPAPPPAPKGPSVKPIIPVSRDGKAVVFTKKEAVPQKKK